MECANWQEGFREGADVGRERLAQEGFNSGYCNGVEEGMNRGHILGQLKYVAYYELSLALKLMHKNVHSQLCVYNEDIDENMTVLSEMIYRIWYYERGHILYFWPLLLLLF